MSLNDQILQIQMNLDQAKEHITQLESGRKSGAPKCRASLQKIKVLAHQLRKDCITTQKAIPVKSRTMVNPVEPIVEAPVAKLEEPSHRLVKISKPVKKPRKAKIMNSNDDLTSGIFQKSGNL